MHWITEPKLSKERKMTNNIHVNARLETVFFKVFSQEKKLAYNIHVNARLKIKGKKKKKTGIQRTCECTSENCILNDHPLKP